MDLRGTVGKHGLIFAGLLQKKRRDKSQCYKMGRYSSPCCSCVAATGCPVFACVVPRVVPLLLGLAISGTSRLLAVVTLGLCLPILVGSLMQPLSAPHIMSPIITLFKGLKQKIKALFYSFFCLLPLGCSLGELRVHIF